MAQNKSEMLPHPRFYFCSYTMTSVGYGDLGPKNIEERTVCTMMILTAGLCWAYVLGDLTWKLEVMFIIFHPSTVPYTLGQSVPTNTQKQRWYHMVVHSSYRLHIPGN